MTPAITETRLIRWSLTATAILFLVMFVVMPLLSVFVEALRQGFGAYLEGVLEPDAIAAVKLTLLVAAISVPLNLLFGLMAAWAIAKFDFPARACSSPWSTFPSPSLPSSAG
ncbi:hypothetical protein [Hankyongella ginsenosidimutans]|uniref:hypothetical protein n=1 Tax=Hankyongella ginsenosidimutans TaxID=1763828 RepID=UPI001FE2E9D0|nr:hypothetical protein [Hankyongella ginsenosidimutans]